MRVYDNGDEMFYRKSSTYGYTNKYDITTTSKAKLDAWLKEHGFTFVGVEV